MTGYWKKPELQSDSILKGHWFDEPITISLINQPSSADDWHFKNVEMEWLNAHWQYQGLFQPYKKLNLKGALNLQGLHANYLPLLSREFIGNEKHLPDALDVEFNGSLDIQGPINSPTLKGVVNSYGLLENQDVEVKAVLAKLDRSHIEVESSKGKWSEGQWQWSGYYNWTDKLVSARIETQTPSASNFKPWLGIVVSDFHQGWLNNWDGSLYGFMDLNNESGQWKIDADLSSKGEFFQQAYQLKWQGEGRLSEALQHTVNGSWGDSTFIGQIESQGKNVQGDMDVQGLQYDQIRQLNNLIPPWLGGSIDSQVNLTGTLKKPAFQAQIASKGQLHRGVQFYPFTANAELTTDQGEWQLRRTLVDMPGAISIALEGSGNGQNGTVDIDGVLSDTRYWIQNDEIGSGEAVFTVKASGDLLEPDLTGEFSWQAQRWPLSIALDLSTQDAKYSLNGSLFSEKQTRIKTNIKAAVRDIRLWPSSWSSSELEVNVAVNTPLSVLDPLFIDRPDQQISGQLQGAMQMNGSLQAPIWEGEVQWFEGMYEHADYGSLVDNIRLSIQAEDDNWAVTGEANDGRNGLIVIDGNLKFTPKETQLFGHDIGIAMNFVSAQLLNRAEMDAAASGTLSMLGSYHNLIVSGDLQVSPLNMQTDTFLWDGAPQLNVISIDETNTGATERPFYWPKGNWDASLIVQQRANLYGQGINAELSGVLNLEDNLYQPVMAGRFDIVRGTYLGFGKLFQLSDGYVQIQNNQLVVNITGEHFTNDLTVSLHITGNQDALSLTLSSDSDLGEDELLAKLLFGKLTEELDVFQAIQLANVINKLRTGKSGTDLVAITRDELTLDTLVVDTESDEEGNLGLNISAGKYLNDYLYMEVEQGVGTEQEFRSSLQLQVTPQTYLELYTQGDGGDFDDNGIELNWSWDY